MSIFDEMSKADVQSRGSKITEPEEVGQTAIFVVKVRETKFFESQQGLGMVFAMEFEVLDGTEKTPPGSIKSWTQFPELASRKRTDQGNIKLLAQTLSGVQGEIPQKVWDEIIENKFAGRGLRLRVEKVLTKSGRYYWTHTWERMPEIPEINTLTKERWLAGEGEGVKHPKNPKYEYNVQHTDWGVRPVQTDDDLPL